MRSDVTGREVEGGMFVRRAGYCESRGGIENGEVEEENGGRREGVYSDEFRGKVREGSVGE